MRPISAIPKPGRPWKRRESNPRGPANGLHTRGVFELFDNVERYSLTPNIRKFACAVKFFIGCHGIRGTYHFFKKGINFGKPLDKGYVIW